MMWACSLVHRLDRGTTGCLVLARTADAARQLSELFETHQIRKTYLALCLGVPTEDQGQMRSFIADGLVNGVGRMSVVSATARGAQLAITDYKILAQSSFQSSLIQLSPLTGRR